MKLEIVTPEDGARAGDDRGAGWTIDILTRGGPTGAAGAATTAPAATTPAATPTGTVSPSPAASPSPAGSPARVAGGSVCSAPAFTAQGQPGPNPAFPGLVVLLSTNQDPRQNLAGLFQIVALDDTSRDRLCHAVWFVLQGRFGVGVDSEVTAFVVEGTAPATIPADRSGLRIISNEETVRFHINGTPTAGSPSPSPTGSPTGSPAASPTGSPRPSPTPTASPTPTRSP